MTRARPRWAVCVGVGVGAGHLAGPTSKSWLVLEDKLDGMYMHYFVLWAEVEQTG